MRVVTFGALGSETTAVTLGEPQLLARLYAEHPLATAAGFFVAGWIGGYAAWWAFGKPTRRRR